MFFNTLPFLAIFIVFLMCYAILRGTTRAGMQVYVVAFSIFFFYSFSGWMCGLLPATALLSWGGTRLMSRAEGWRRKAWLTAVILVSLAPLIYFKYTDFGITIFNQLFKENFPLLQLAMPVGISFYTFQAISYAIDVYRRQFTLKVNLLEYLFYISFFPLLLAGPITRAETLIPQIRERRKVNERVVYTGLWLIIIGLIKKSVIADYLAQYNNWIFDDPTAYSGFENLMAAVGYTIQIYCDFSGYSDMAIGIAALMGIELCENFCFPYQSLNVSEFWHRWHLSLSFWFRDYLYIPLGGNRKGRLRTYLNNVLTMLIAGLWHGATWMFVLWGALHGAALVIHKLCRSLFLDRIPVNWLTRPVFWLATHIFIICTWVVFRSTDLQTCNTIFSQILYDFDIAYLPHFLLARPLWVIIVILAYLAHHTRDKHFCQLQDWFVRSPWLVKLLLFLATVQLAIQFSSSSIQPFIYMQF